MASKLFKITMGNGKTYNIIAEGLSEIEKVYDTNFKSVEIVDNKPVVLGSKKSDLLMDCLNFIDSGANTRTNEERVELQDKIKQNLGI